MANENVKKNDPGVTFVNQNEELESLKKERDALNAAYKEQQRMMLNQLRADDTNPFMTAVDVAEVGIIQKIKDLCDKHANGGGISQKEASELYRYQNEITKMRKVSLSYEDRGTIGNEDMIPKNMGQRLVLDFKVPAGYVAYAEVDTPALGGRLLRERLAMGYRFMQNDATIRCEADGEVWNPEFKDSGIVVRQGGVYGNPPQPCMYYLMVIAKPLFDARQKERMNAINSMVKEDSQTKRSRMEQELQMAGATDGMILGSGMQRF